MCCPNLRDNLDISLAKVGKVFKKGWKFFLTSVVSFTLLKRLWLIGTGEAFTGGCWRTDPYQMVWKLLSQASGCRSFILDHYLFYDVDDLEGTKDFYMMISFLISMFFLASLMLGPCFSTGLDEYNHWLYIWYEVFCSPPCCLQHEIYWSVYWRLPLRIDYINVNKSISRRKKLF